MKHTPLYLATRYYVAQIFVAGRAEQAAAAREASAAEQCVAEGMAMFKRTNPIARLLAWMGRA